MSPDAKTTGYTPVRPSIIEEVEALSGFVVLIDVLGFRELVSRDEKLSQVKEYVNTVHDLLTTEKYGQLQFVLFSDNLVINTRDEKRESFLELIRACSETLFSLARHEIAVRGAVAHGSFLRSLNAPQGVILAGRPIVEAEHYQHSQNWVGIMLSPSVVRRDNEALQNECRTIPDRRTDESERQWLERIALPLHLMKWSSIPFHDKASMTEAYFDGFAILPIRPEISSIAEIVPSLENTLKFLEIMKAAAPNPSSQKKYSESIKFLQHARDVWKPVRELNFLLDPTKRRPLFLAVCN